MATLGKNLNEKTWKSRNFCRVSSGSVGAEGMEADFAMDRHPETNAADT